jgi:hypothetical protein
VVACFCVKSLDLFYTFICLKKQNKAKINNLMRIKLNVSFNLSARGFSFKSFYSARCRSPFLRFLLPPCGKPFI